MPPDLLTSGEAAAQLGISVVTLRWWLATGKIQGRKIAGRIWLFDPAEVERIAKHRRQQRQQQRLKAS